MTTKVGGRIEKSSEPMQYMETEIGQMQRNELSINMYSEPGRHAVRRKKIEALEKLKAQQSKRYEQTKKAKIRRNVYRQFRKVVREAVKKPQPC